MKNYLLVSCILMLVSLSLMAESKQEIKYYGQNGENLSLDIIKNETRYTYEEVNTTCTRQIPHSREVCGWETYYRQGPCHWEPGRETCRTEGGGRDCRYEPGRTQCRTNSSGREVCRDLPGHRVCTNRPGRRVCTTGSGRNICPQVSYTEYECHDQTTYTTESYACVQTVAIPYIVKRKVNANVKVAFKSFDVTDPKFDVTIELQESGQVTIKAVNRASSSALMFAKKEVEVDDAGDDEITVNAKILTRVVDRNTYLAPVTKGIKKVSLTTTQLSFVLGKIRNKKMITVTLNISKKGFAGFGRQTVVDKTFDATDFKVEEVNGKSKLTLQGTNFSSVPKKGKRYTTSITVKMKTGGDLDLITPITGDLKATFKAKLKAK